MLRIKELNFIFFFMPVFLIACKGQKLDNKFNNIKVNNMENTLNKYGIESYKAPELNVPIWIDGDGNEIKDPISLSDYEGKYKVIYCFQAWCPGCHSRGFPALKEMVEALKGNAKVEFFAVQTVFEGAEANTIDKVKEIQKEYDLKIPFGHDVGDKSSRNISTIMNSYRTGGTPWFILINQEGTVVFNDFHLNVKNAIDYLKEIN